MQEDFIWDLKGEKSSLKRNHLDFLQRIRNKNYPIFIIEYANHLPTYSRIKTELENHDTKYIEKKSDGAFINYFVNEQRVPFLRKSEEEYKKEGKSVDKIETDLDYELKQQDVANILITGIGRYHCVLKTAQQALDRGYNVLTCNDLIDGKAMDLEAIEKWYKQNTTNYKTLTELLQNL